MATAAAVERFRAQGKQQLNVWVDSDTAALLKTLAAQRSESYGDVLRSALIALHSGQPVPPAAPAIGGDSLDRLSASVNGLHEDITSLRSIVGDWSSAFEARLSAVEAMINAAPVLPIPSNNYTPETPVRAAPGGNEAPGKKLYNSDKKNDLETRRAIFIELHHKGLTPTEISRAVKKEGFLTGTGISGIHEYLQSKELTPNRSRG